MHTFSESLDIMSDGYKSTIDQISEMYKARLIVVVRYHVAKEYLTFTGNIYFEINRDFLSVVVNSHVPQHRMVKSIQQNLYKHLCTLSPNLLQCLDDVTITI